MLEPKLVQVSQLETSFAALYSPCAAWSCWDKVNLLKQWFGRHPHGHQAGAPMVQWPGQSGKEYTYKIYPITTPFRPLPGNFIYAKQDEECNWIPLYIAQSRDMHQRLEGHFPVESAIEHGATHVHMHYDNVGHAARCTEERDLIERWHPPFNDF